MSDNKGEIIKSCFMNGKSCIYEREIKKTLKKQSDRKTAFIIMPFEKHLTALFQWEISPFLKSRGYDPVRADEINRVGYIICEKICKKIQEADLVVVDISYDNQNVFYEMGLSMALQKPLLIMSLKDNFDESQEKNISEGFAKIYMRRDIERTFGIKRGKVLTYPKFGELKIDPASFSNYIIDDYVDFPLSSPLSDGQAVSLQKMNGNKIYFIDTSRENEQRKNDNNNNIITIADYEKKHNISMFSYDFVNLCKSAAGAAIARIMRKEDPEKYDWNWVDLYGPDEAREKIISIEEIATKSDDVPKIFEKLANCGCAIIDITENHNTNFFWLGYIHGISGNVIPINKINVENENIHSVPFDIRALWHIVYDDDNPSSLTMSFFEILRFIYETKAETQNRDKFWANILEGSGVSIYLGSYRLEGVGRNTIGDWDYRTAAEITSYLTTKKETIDVTLASPIPKCTEDDVKEPSKKRSENEYVKSLEAILREDKDCIIIASPDVNDLTEVALSKIFSTEPFTEIKGNKFTGFISYKEYIKGEKIVQFPHAFYSYEEGNERKRGFKFIYGLKSDRITEIHHPPGVDPHEDQLDILMGQLIVSKNPCNPNRRIIIISGISGPATFGIAQMLTGGVYTEFTVDAYTGSKSGADLENNKVDEIVRQYVDKYMTDKDKNNENDNKSDNIKECYNVNERKIDYKKLSEIMIKKITEKYSETENGFCSAIINVGVYNPKTNNVSKDERKIIAYNFRDLDNDPLTLGYANPTPKKTYQ